MGLLSSLFGGGGRSSSQANTTTNTTNQDNRIGQDGSLNLNDLQDTSLHIEQVDTDIIKSVSDAFSNTTNTFLEATKSLFTETNENTTKLVNKAIAGNQELSDKLLVESSTQGGSIAKEVIFAAIAGIAVILIWGK